MTAAKQAADSLVFSDVARSCGSRQPADQMHVWPIKLCLKDVAGACFRRLQPRDVSSSLSNHEGLDH